MAEHLVVSVYPSNGQIRVVCSCGERSSGFDRRSARDKHDAHAAENRLMVRTPTGMKEWAPHACPRCGRLHNVPGCPGPVMRL